MRPPGRQQIKGQKRTMGKTEVFRKDQSGGACLAAFHAYGHIGDFPLVKRTTFGRFSAHGGADLQVPVPGVSGLHGEFGCAEGHWFYRDRGSTNGTRVNGQMLTGVCELHDGDILTVVPGGGNERVDLMRVDLRGEMNPGGGDERVDLRGEMSPGDGDERVDLRGEMSPGDGNERIDLRGQIEEPMFAGIFMRLREGEELLWRRIPIGLGMEPIRIGRMQSGLTPDDPAISGRHAVFRYAEEGLSVLDEGSKNGVFVNGERCDARRLRMLDVVRLGRSFFVVTDGVLWEGELRAKAVRADTVPGAAIVAAPGADVIETIGTVSAATANSIPRKDFPAGNRLVIDIDERSVRKNFKKRVLLSGIHLAIEPGDMVLILGGSGAGKSTFFRSVMGYDRAEGTIRYGDKDVYDDYETMKREIGYVPQQDLVRMSDTVEDTLMAAAKLRMPGDSTAAEQKARVEWLMDILGLTDERSNLIGAVSGGQKKRVSIGIELAADPALFFLDEPDSGLDGVMARGLMEKLRVIADLGKIVLVITHSPDRAADLFTKVVVLGKTQDGVGHMIYYGTPGEALAFFETDKLENIVHRINRSSEGGEGLADEFYNRFTAAQTT